MNIESIGITASQFKELCVRLCVRVCVKTQNLYDNQLN